MSRMMAWITGSPVQVHGVQGDLGGEGAAIRGGARPVEEGVALVHRLLDVPRRQDVRGRAAGLVFHTQILGPER
jgi:hypothetical protein